jgi:signal transduction histidine kinase
MLPEHKRLAETVNAIGEGLDAAVEKSMKSERLKTDLITNVSHDIKTPLTSIINYVDLLKKENFQDSKIQHYIEVLEQKAQRLKVLTEDVVEASKVSSGNVTLEYMNINLVEMIQQTSGEFEEKFKARNLTEVLNLPDQDAIIYVDGRRMWRVLENIYNNAAKYAMEGTRVYADLKVLGKEVSFSLKNISEQPLNIDADELTERFIRGDISRSTEGSGLGLSIAKNLTELQGGKFELYLDGDLFKVTLKFPVGDGVF